MNLLNGKIRNIYFKYLAAAFGSALITSIYTIVDTAMIGQYHGPDGAAALAVVSPIWKIIYSLELLMGIGGSLLSLAITISHFFTKRNTIRFEKPTELSKMLGKITAAGFATFFIDMAMGIMAMLFNRQIMKYLGTDALAVYGIIINISTVVQCCAYSVGQASQPIISTNYGAKQGNRILYCFGIERRCNQRSIYYVTAIHLT